jgi:hypothetical protein
LIILSLVLFSRLIRYGFFAADNDLRLINYGYEYPPLTGKLRLTT